MTDLIKEMKTIPYLEVEILEENAVKHANARKQIKELLSKLQPIKGAPSSEKNDQVVVQATEILLRTLKGVRSMFPAFSIDVTNQRPQTSPEGQRSEHPDFLLCAGEDKLRSTQLMPINAIAKWSLEERCYTCNSCRLNMFPSKGGRAWTAGEWSVIARSHVVASLSQTSRVALYKCYLCRDFGTTVRANTPGGLLLHMHSVHKKEMDKISKWLQVSASKIGKRSRMTHGSAKSQHQKEGVKLRPTAESPQQRNATSSIVDREDDEEYLSPNGGGTDHDVGDRDLPGQWKEDGEINISPEQGEKEGKTSEYDEGNSGGNDADSVENNEIEVLDELEGVDLASILEMEHEPDPFSPMEDDVIDGDAIGLQEILDDEQSRESDDSVSISGWDLSGNDSLDMDGLAVDSDLEDSWNFQADDSEHSYADEFKAEQSREIDGSVSVSGWDLSDNDSLTADILAVDFELEDSEEL
ncbi:hypothetical protein P154DRAFT_602221 [Amniculicola lignicola CBS 123094]|uniref:Uncharacterized protein n=1 Tax=Amniculicola lignicola CBS 123094 TaxID=1392246 RepID=A0A6A5WIQ1_9PLEO|nr:hypothetical protein P154DRAFT_602221 [Amniculicola lignicola CBS 123094]